MDLNELAKKIAELSPMDLMDGVFGSGVDNPWWIGVEIEGIWEDPESVTVESWTKDEEDSHLKTKLTMDDLKRGLALAITLNYHHCGEPMTADPEDWDACTADLILQCAIYGEEVYA